MKIAVCVSGHFRFADYASRQNKWFYDLLKNSGHHVDMFLHTWSDYHANHHYKFKNLVAKDSVPRNLEHWWGQWISASRCANLVSDDYDIVIRARPDNLLFKTDSVDQINDILDDIVDNNKLYTSELWGLNEVLYIQDQFFITNYNTYKKMFNIDNVYDILNKSNTSKRYNSVSTVGHLLSKIAFTPDQRVQSVSYLDYFKHRLCRQTHLEIDPNELNFITADKIYQDYQSERQKLKREKVNDVPFKDWI